MAFFIARALSIMSSFLQVKLWIKKCTSSSLVVLEIRSEGNAIKMENQQLVSPSRQCSSTPVGFGHGFLSKEQCVNTGASPILSWPGCCWSLPVPSTEISIEGTKPFWYNWHDRECHVRAEKSSTKWLPGMFPAPLRSLAEVHRWTRGVL